MTPTEEIEAIAGNLVRWHLEVYNADGSMRAGWPQVLQAEVKAAAKVADLDGDGKQEIITGKRFMAHNGSDPDASGKKCVFFYRFMRGAEPVFTKHIVSYDEGYAAGLNIVAVDIDGDGDIDLVTTGKWGGPVLFENLLK